MSARPWRKQERDACVACSGSPSAKISPDKAIPKTNTGTVAEMKMERTLSEETCLGDQCGMCH